MRLRTIVKNGSRARSAVAHDHWPRDQADFICMDFVAGSIVELVKLVGRTRSSTHTDFYEYEILRQAPQLFQRVLLR